jgi:hypothetical protein
MQPQDVFNRAFDDATGAIDAWLPTVAGTAVVDREQTDGYWRLRLIPHEPSACPVELMLSRAQTFDCDIGTESAQAQPIADLGIFLPLLKSVTDGRVFLRTWGSQATGSEIMREQIVVLDADKMWSIRRMVRAGSAATEATAVARDHVYVGYKRG